VLVVLITKQERFIAEFASDKNVKIGKYLAKLQPKTRLSRTLSSCLTMCWPGVQNTQDNHVLACSFAKYSQIH